MRIPGGDPRNLANARIPQNEWWRKRRNHGRVKETEIGSTLKLEMVNIKVTCKNDWCRLVLTVSRAEARRSMGSHTVTWMVGKPRCGLDWGTSRRGQRRRGGTREGKTGEWLVPVGTLHWGRESEAWYVQE